MSMNRGIVMIQEAVGYADAASKLLCTLPTGAVPLFAVVQTEVAFNDSGTDTLDLGIAGDDDYFAAGINVATAGGQMVVFSHSPELALMTGVTGEVHRPERRRHRRPGCGQPGRTPRPSRCTEPPCPRTSTCATSVAERRELRHAMAEEPSVRCTCGQADAQRRGRVVSARQPAVALWPGHRRPAGDPVDEAKGQQAWRSRPRR